MRIAFLAAAALIGGLVAAPANVRADAALDRIFDAEQLSDVEAGTALGYTHTRSSVALDKVPNIADRQILVKIEDEAENAGKVTVQMKEDGRDVSLDPFDAATGNPVLLIFLESSVQAIAKSTGGSPFYIKNRVKDAFRRGTQMVDVDIDIDGEKVKMQRVTYRPFAEEKNKERLLQFANLGMVFTLSKDIPGGIAQLAAYSDLDTLEGFSEIIAYDGIAETPE